MPLHWTRTVSRGNPSLKCFWVRGTWGIAFPNLWSWLAKVLNQESRLHQNEIYKWEFCTSNLPKITKTSSLWSVSSIHSIVAVVKWFYSLKREKQQGKESEGGCFQSKETNYLSTKTRTKTKYQTSGEPCKLVLIFVLTATFGLEHEDDYENEFSVLSTRFRFGGRKISKCACSELIGRSYSRHRTPPWRSLTTLERRDLLILTQAVYMTPTGKNVTISSSETPHNVNALSQY